MKTQLFVCAGNFWLVAIASSLALTVNPVYAQVVAPQPKQSSPSLPNSTPGTQPLIRREQAPLPLNQIYQTPIEQFEPPFSDVPRDHWAYEAVTRLFYTGTVKDNSPSPNSSQPQ